MAGVKEREVLSLEDLHETLVLQILDELRECENLHLLSAKYNVRLGSLKRLIRDAELFAAVQFIRQGIEDGAARRMAHIEVWGKEPEPERVHVFYYEPRTAAAMR